MERNIDLSKFAIVPDHWDQFQKIPIIDFEGKVFLKAPYSLLRSVIDSLLDYYKADHEKPSFEEIFQFVVELRIADE